MSDDSAFSFKRLLVGKPIPSSLAHHERLSRVTGLAVLSSDALSSVAYATDFILATLVVAGVAAFTYAIPISLVIATLLAIVAFSYRQTIHAYPTGGGAYIVAKENIGATAGLVAAASLLVDYTLTVSVSISAGVLAITSAFPRTDVYRVEMCLVFLALLMVGNLRGIRESGRIFAVPTYFFVCSISVLILAGLYHYVTGGVEQLTVPLPPGAGQGRLTTFLLLTAFANGCTAMTGVEAVSNGVPAFRPPESKNASATLVAMAVLAIGMFVGITVLAHAYGVIPNSAESGVSQLGRAIFGDRTVLYYLLQAATTMILVLAANTAYADFPRLASLLARDNYLPKQLALRGERLAFSNGIVILGGMSALLIVVFAGSTGALLPLYAVGVFAAFTLSQAGMVQHWRTLRGAHWRLKATLNGVGAIATGLVTLIAAATGIMNPDLPIVPGLPIGWGSWLVLVIVPAFIWVFKTIKRHYDEAEKETALPPSVDAIPERPLKNVVVVPIARLNRPAVQALRYAQALSHEVTAVHVATDPQKAQEIEDEWPTWGRGVPLTIVESPYRSLTRPLLQYVAELRRHEQAETVTVVLPEYVPDSWWQHLLHGQSAQFLKLSLLFTPGFVVTSVPIHPRDEDQEELAAATP